MEFIRLKFTYANVFKLIEHGVIEDINIVVPFMGGLTLLHIAAFNNDQKLADYLLRKEADVNSQSRYWGTALHIAVIMDNPSVLESLIKYGADVNTQLIADSSLIRFKYAAKENHEEIPEFLLKIDTIMSATLNSYHCCYGKSPLHIAVDRSNEQMVELLLKNNANPNIDTDNFKTPLICAIYKDNLPIIKLLLAYGADVNSVSGGGFSKESPLHAAVQSINSEAVKLILNDDMVDINIVTKCKNSSLHYGVLFAIDDVIIRQLLNAGVDINLKNANGKMAFALKLNNSQKVIDAITEHVAKLSAANFYIDSQNLAAVSSEKFCKLRDQCSREIEKMKKTYICTSNVTFYNVLCNKYEHKLAVSLKYVSDSILDLDIQSLFPLYSGMITYRLRKALARKKLLLNAISLTDDIFNDIQLPNTFTREIFKLLSNNDLKKLQ